VRRVLTLIVCITALVLSACGKNPQNNNARIRFLHGSLDSGTLSIRLNNDSTDFASGLTYQSANAYQDIGAGAQEIKVVGAGGVNQLDSTFNLAKGSSYTLAIFGTASATAGTMILDDIAAPASGNMKLRLAHLAAGVGALDVYALAAGADLNTSNPRAIATATGTTSPFVEFTTGAYRIVLTPQGSKDVVYDSGSQTFADKAAATLVIYSSGSTKLANGTLLLTDGSGTAIATANPYARIKTVNAAPDYAFIDTLVDGSIKFSNVPYKGVSSYLIVPAGARNLKVEATNAPGTFLANTTATLASGRDYSVVVTEQGATTQIVPLADTNLLPSLGRDRLRFVNATTDASSLDVLINYTKQVGNLARATASAYLEVDANTYNFTFNAAGTTTALLVMPSVTFDANQRYTLYVVGSGSQLSGVVTVDN